MTPSANVPFVDGKGESFANYAREVGQRGQVANLESARQASALILKMDAVAREVCMAAGSNQIMNQIMVREVVE